SFVIAENALAKAWYISQRHFYHQRGAHALAQPFTAWTRPKGHTEPTVSCGFRTFGVPYIRNLFDLTYLDPHVPTQYDRFDAIGGTMKAKIDHERQTIEYLDPLPRRNGGWYDAADYDSNDRHYLPVLDMLYLFESDPQKFTDNQLNIPESGNGIPD